MPSSLDQIQAEVGAWAEKTFPLAAERSILKHLREELDELDEAVWEARPHASSLDLEAIAEEAADVFLILLHLCHRNGVSLEAAAARKFAACRERTWAVDPERGYARHVNEETTSNA